MARIESEATRMGVLVEGLLLLARLDELPETERVPVDLGELAAQAAADARARAPERTVTLDVQDPVHALADPDAVRQVLANLIGNALIHTPEWTRVDISVRRESGQAVLRSAITGRDSPPTPGSACSIVSGVAREVGLVARAARVSVWRSSASWSTLITERSRRPTIPTGAPCSLSGCPRRPAKLRRFSAFLGDRLRQARIVVRDDEPQGVVGSTSSGCAYTGEPARVGSVSGDVASTVMLLALSDHDAASRDADGHASREAHALLTVELHGATQVPRSYFGLSTEYWALARFERRPSGVPAGPFVAEAGGRPVRPAHRRRFG